MNYLLNEHEYQTLIDCRERLKEAKKAFSDTGIALVIDNKTRQARIPGLSLIHEESRKDLFLFFAYLNMTNEIK